MPAGDEDTDAPINVETLPLPTYDDGLALRKRPRGFGGFDVLGDIVRGGAGHALHFWNDDVVTVAYDAYPKASVHLLAMPRRLPTAAKVSALTREEHAVLVERLARVAADIVAHLKRTTHPGVMFQCGFHAVPSLQPLHLHVMSTDVERSANLKTKRHYLTFTTKFFVPISLVRTMLDDAGDTTALQCAALDELANKGPLRCLWCGAVLPNMSALKQHIAACARNRSRPAPSS
jgi:aprataxin